MKTIERNLKQTETRGELRQKEGNGTSLCVALTFSLRGGGSYTQNKSLSSFLNERMKFGVWGWLETNERSKTCGY